jgi:hypothetical protein
LKIHNQREKRRNFAFLKKSVNMKRSGI